MTHTGRNWWTNRSLILVHILSPGLICSTEFLILCLFLFSFYSIMFLCHNSNSWPAQPCNPGQKQPGTPVQTWPQWIIPTSWIFFLVTNNSSNLLSLSESRKRTWSIWTCIHLHRHSYVLAFCIHCEFSACPCQHCLGIFLLDLYSLISINCRCRPWLSVLILWIYEIFLQKGFIRNLGNRCACKRSVSVSSQKVLSIRLQLQCGEAAVTV